MKSQKSPKAWCNIYLGQPQNDLNFIHVQFVKFVPEELQNIITFFVCPTCCVAVIRDPTASTSSKQTPFRSFVWDEIKDIIVFEPMIRPIRQTSDFNYLVSVEARGLPKFFRHLRGIFILNVRAKYMHFFLNLFSLQFLAPRLRGVVVLRGEWPKPLVFSLGKSRASLEAKTIWNAAGTNCFGRVDRPSQKIVDVRHSCNNLLLVSFWRHSAFITQSLPNVRDTIPPKASIVIKALTRRRSNLPLQRNPVVGW